MSFGYTTRSISTAALQLDYFLVPWDTEILGVPVAQISELRVSDPAAAARDYEEFARWCAQEGIALCSCRVPAERVADSIFLEERGFRTIELNYLPRLEQLQSRSLPQDTLQVATATTQDREPLADMAVQVFRHGRFHQDPRIDPTLGDRRYRAWMWNARFAARNPRLACSMAPSPGSSSSRRRRPRTPSGRSPVSHRGCRAAGSASASGRRCSGITRPKVRRQ